MPDILNLKSYDWELAVWSRDVNSSRNILERTLERRDKELLENEIRLQPTCPISLIGEDSKSPITYDICNSFCTSSPLFFENKHYEFEILFDENSVNLDDDSEPTFVHNLKSVEDSFHFNKRSKSLRATLNFGNDIGWFKLEFKYFNKVGKEISQCLSFEVLPLKMDMQGDLQEILGIIDKKFPLWRYSICGKTDQQLARSRKPHERFALLWLANFESLREELESGVKVILNAPHSRLLPDTKQLRAERIHGRLSSRLEEKVKEGLKSKQFEKRYVLERRKLSVDTPENRLIKALLKHCASEISRLITKARHNDKSPEKALFSESFYTKLESWRRPLESYLQQPLFREIGHFEGMARESLVLHERAGYSKVYRVWQQLKMYLDVFGDDASLSTKTIDELYEVWCFIEIGELLEHKLGFTRKTISKSRLYDKGLEKQLRRGAGSTWQFERDLDGLRISLVHEPTYRNAHDPEKLNGHKFFSWSTTQKPDIVLEAIFKDGRKLHWLFDAKYRIKTDERDTSSNTDFVPDDAINQMHRYRDALLWQHEELGTPSSYRTVVGAYCLYPGFFKQEEDTNPHQQSIDKIGIGAFSLLPGEKGNLWLQNFLEQKLGKAEGSPYTLPDADTHYAEESARIAPLGMYLAGYKDLTLVAPLGNDRSKDYYKNFNRGKAHWYHMPVETSKRAYLSKSVLNELRYCALTEQENKINYLYPIKSVTIKTRNEISSEQSGVDASENSDAKYWLFELGSPSFLYGKTKLTKEEHFTFKLCTAAELRDGKTWEELSDRYQIMPHKQDKSSTSEPD